MDRLGLRRLVETHWTFLNAFPARLATKKINKNIFAKFMKAMFVI